MMLNKNLKGFMTQIYREGLKNREFGQGGSSDFLAGTSGIAKGKTRSEDEKYGAKPTPDKTDSPITSGINGARIEENNPSFPLFLLIGMPTRCSGPVRVISQLSECELDADAGQQLGFFPFLPNAAAAHFQYARTVSRPASRHRASE